MDRNKGMIDGGRSVNYISQMFDVRQTETFRDWLDSLTDKRAKARIAQRLVRLQAGLMGDVKFFSGIGELRIDSGPGYRVYFAQRGKVLIILLCGGDKSSQRRDVRKAIELSSELDM